MESALFILSALGGAGGIWLAHSVVRDWRRERLAYVVMIAAGVGGMAAAMYLLLWLG